MDVWNLRRRFATSICPVDVSHVEKIPTSCTFHCMFGDIWCDSVSIINLMQCGRGFHFIPPFSFVFFPSLLLVYSFSVGARNPMIGGASHNGGSISPNIMTGLPPAGSVAAGVTPSAPPPAAPSDTRPGSRAKVLYDYDAADASELSLKADEVWMKC